MGWVSDRKMRTGTSLNTNEGVKISDKGQLRKIKHFIIWDNSFFGAHLAMLECGHEQTGYGEHRMRCETCGKKKEGEES